MKNQKAFTLIELLVVVAIIGLLSSVVIVGLKDAKERAEEKTAMEFAHTVRVSLGSDLVGEWTFDDSTNLGKDTSGNDNHGTNNGVAPTDGIIRGAGEFNGSSDYISISDNAVFDTGGELTLEAWINPDGAQAYDCPIIHDLSNYKYLFYFPSDGGFQFGVRTSSGTSFTIKHTLPSGWVHVVGVYDKSASPRLKLYVDGTQEKTAVGYNEDITPGDEGIHIGTRYNQVGSGFNGDIDEVRIYNRALTTAEIQKHYVEGAVKHNIVLK